MKPAFTHCALHVQDMDDTIAFYERFCGLKVVRRHGEGPNDEAAWLAEEGHETLFVLVLVSGGNRQTRADSDITHYGFSVETRDEVDKIAKEAALAGWLYKEPRQLPPPVGYLCFLEDPDGYIVEFSFGQPLGTGTDEA
jgi:catechol 2,3-dioxygenase-like lactoylglutathione lyase family enzyme